MGPIKRTHNLSESPDVPSGQQHENRKRARLSGASVSEEVHPFLLSTPSTSSLDHTDDEHEYKRATQALRDKYEMLGENRPVENGIIERVDCYNFMCHEHLSMELGPLINFIVGKNGSGKSAVLSALTICLGGKASATNRGQSLRKFIKEGKESATIVVRIKNQGDSAYLPNEFGRSITIERHFSKSGTSGFRIKNASGRVVSTKRSDLDSITDYFALQIDNPMNVLTQDMARQFLSSSSPAEKYRFFVKGVQLEQLDQDYHLIEESIEHLNTKILTHSGELKDLEAKRDKARARLALSNRHEGIRARLRNLRAQMAWVQVEEQERIRDSFDEEIIKATQKITVLEGEVERSDALYQDADSACGIAVNLVREAKSELDTLHHSKKEIQSRYDSDVQERHELQATQRTIRDHIKAAEVRIEDMKQQIAQEIQRLEGINGGSKAQRLSELEEMNAAVEAVRNRHLEHKKDISRLQREIVQAENKVKDTGEPITKQRQEIHQAEHHLRILMKDRLQQENALPETMSKLIRAIQGENSFCQKPIGPLGIHVTLLKPQWSSILEKSFGNTLSGFVVTSKRDMNILSGIMQRVDCTFPIFIGNEAGTMDTSAYEPETKFDTALRILKIDNDLVRRQLIINHSIEQMLLIEDLREASSVMFTNAPPKNVRRCYCIDARDRRRGIHLGFSRTGDPTQSPLGAYTGRARMKTDIEMQIRMQHDVINTLKDALRELESEHRNALNNLQKCKQALVRHERRERDLHLEVQKAEDFIEQLKEAIERDSVEDGRLDWLKVALTESEDDKRVAEASYEDGINALDAMMEKLKSIKRELAAKDAEIVAIDRKVRMLESEESRASARRRKALDEKNAAISQVEAAIRDKIEIERNRQETVARVIDFSEKASMVAPRVNIDDGETPRSLDKKLEKLTQGLQQYEKEMGASREEIATAAAEADAKCERSKEQITDFKQLSEMLFDTLRNRRERWDKFRSHISARAKLQFTYLLSERSFRGKLLTNHKEKLLDLQVEPDSTKKSSGRGTKTLSGGEKSFSQICLLLALWEAMGSPIRCLDEFDVYMDSVNRKITIELLMNAARRSVGRQFILITPGSRAEIRVAPDVRVIELAEPERGQSTISFGR
ncbi:DNA repair protein Rad18 [Coccidioides posadasii str. Silveira]|uniref:DNA repair protein Rad18 n=2 Tax=Coccidioides posadasii (strain RMSCC 757 / Silveira) TaxID=443226 RepID=E9DAD9_COCPS|nr:DNA repair protein Rad18 [Coccidioides posadasii str. Silveira]